MNCYWLDVELLLRGMNGAIELRKRVCARPSAFMSLAIGSLLLAETAFVSASNADYVESFKL